MLLNHALSSFQIHVFTFSPVFNCVKTTDEITRSNTIVYKSLGFIFPCGWIKYQYLWILLFTLDQIITYLSHWLHCINRLKYSLLIFSWSDNDFAIYKVEIWPPEFCVLLFNNSNLEFTRWSYSDIRCLLLPVLYYAINRNLPIVH